MNSITKQLAAILAGISKDRRPEMAEHFNRLDELKDLLMAAPKSFIVNDQPAENFRGSLPTIECDELLEEWNSQLEGS